jgi:hypothetical protein
MRLNLFVNQLKSSSMFRISRFWILMSLFLFSKGLHAGVGFSDVFLVKNDTNQIIQVNMKQGNAELQIWMDKYEQRRVGCRLFGETGIGPVEFLGDFKNWKDAKVIVHLKENTGIYTENAETDEGNVYCVRVAQEGKNGEFGVIRDDLNCNTNLYGEGMRKLKFTIEVNNQFDEPVWVGVMEEKVGFKMCVPPHAELTDLGDRPSEAAVETSRTINLRDIFLDSKKLGGPQKLNISAIYNAKQNENAFSDDPIVLGMDTMIFFLPLKETKERAGILSDQPYLKVTVIKSDIRNVDAPSGETPVMGYEYNMILESATKQDKVDYEGKLLGEK